MKTTTAGILTVLGLLIAGQAQADFTPEDAARLDRESIATLDKFQSDTPEAKTLIEHANGVLVCPKITKGGFIVGVESGKCTLRVRGETVEHYRTQSGKLGLLIGVQSYSMILVFNQQAVLDTFRTGKRVWEVGVDASVAVAGRGASGKMDSTNLQQAIVAFIFGEHGLMADLSIEGSNFRKIAVQDK